MSDDLTDLFKRDVDRTLLRENLKLTHQERFDKFHGVMRSLMAIRQAGIDARAKKLLDTKPEQENKCPE